MHRVTRHRVLGWGSQAVIPIARRHKTLFHSRFSTSPGLATPMEPPDPNGTRGNGVIDKNGQAKSGTGDDKSGHAKGRTGEGEDMKGGRVWRFPKEDW